MTDREDPAEEKRFRENVLVIFDTFSRVLSDLRSKNYRVPNELSIKIAEGILEQIDSVILIQGFIRRSYPHWKEIKAKNRHYFIENIFEIFDNIPGQSYINDLKVYFQMREGDTVETFKPNPENSDDTRDFLVPDFELDELFRIFKAQIRISIQYVHKSQEPYREVVDGKVIESYNTYYNLIDHGYSMFQEKYSQDFSDLTQLAEDWKITLTFPDV